MISQNLMILPAVVDMVILSLNTYNVEVLAIIRMKGKIKLVSYADKMVLIFYPLIYVSLIPVNGKKRVQNMKFFT